MFRTGSSDFEIKPTKDPGNLVQEPSFFFTNNYTPFLYPS